MSSKPCRASTSSCVHRLSTFSKWKATVPSQGPPLVRAKESKWRRGCMLSSHYSRGPGFGSHPVLNFPHFRFDSSILLVPSAIPSCCYRRRRISCSMGHLMLSHYSRPNDKSSLHILGSSFDQLCSTNLGCTYQAANTGLLVSGE